jgi:hypothetical protein
MLRVLIMLEPGGDASREKLLTEVTIINITRGAGRMSSDYAWRIRRAVRKIGDDPVSYGCLVDSYNGDAASLLLEVLSEWKSGRAAPIDNHGYAVSLIEDHAAYWKSADPTPRSFD